MKEDTGESDDEADDLIAFPAFLLSLIPVLNLHNSSNHFHHNLLFITNLHSTVLINYLQKMEGTIWDLKDDLEDDPEASQLFTPSLPIQTKVLLLNLLPDPDLTIPVTSRLWVYTVFDMVVLLLIDKVLKPWVSILCEDGTGLLLLFLFGFLPCILHSSRSVFYRDEHSVLFMVVRIKPHIHQLQTPFSVTSVQEFPFYSSDKTGIFLSTFLLYQGHLPPRYTELLPFLAYISQSIIIFFPHVVLPTGSNLLIIRKSQPLWQRCNLFFPVASFYLLSSESYRYNSLGIKTRLWVIFTRCFIRMFLGWDRRFGYVPQIKTRQTRGHGYNNTSLTYVEFILVFNLPWFIQVSLSFRRISQWAYTYHFDLLGTGTWGWLTSMTDEFVMRLEMSWAYLIGCVLDTLFVHDNFVDPRLTDITPGMAVSTTTYFGAYIIGENSRWWKILCWWTLLFILLCFWFYCFCLACLDYGALLTLTTFVMAFVLLLQWWWKRTPVEVWLWCDSFRGYLLCPLFCKGADRLVLLVCHFSNSGHSYGWSASSPNLTLLSKLVSAIRHLVWLLFGVYPQQLVLYFYLAALPLLALTSNIDYPTCFGTLGFFGFLLCIMVSMLL